MFEYTQSTVNCFNTFTVSVSETPPDMRLVIQLSEQVTELSVELDEANKVLAQYEKDAREGLLKRR